MLKKVSAPCNFKNQSGRAKTRGKTGELGVEDSNKEKLQMV